MKQIDFLPQRYREKDVRRRAGVWRLLVCVLIGGAIAATSAMQYAYRSAVQAQLDAVQPLLAESKVKNQQLAQMQLQLTNVTHQANVCALLELPITRTQILAATLIGAPESLAIENLRIARRSSVRPGHNNNRPAANNEKNEAELPAARDAKLLEEWLRGGNTVVELSGRTRNVADLHSYLERLERSDLIARAELLAMESSSAGPAQDQHHFNVEVHITSEFGEGAAQTERTFEGTPQLD